MGVELLPALRDRKLLTASAIRPGPVRIPAAASLVLLLGQGAKAYAPRMALVAGVVALQSASRKVIIEEARSKMTSRWRMIDAPMTVPPRWLSKMAAHRWRVPARLPALIFGNSTMY